MNNNLKTNKKLITKNIWTTAMISKYFESSCLLLLFYKAPQNAAHPLCHSENLNTLLVFWYQMLFNHRQQGAKKNPLVTEHYLQL